MTFLRAEVLLAFQEFLLTEQAPLTDDPSKQ
jgi:hypothetical protein